MAEVATMNKAQQRKRVYKDKLVGLLNEYSQIVVINVDNVGSSQLQQVRIKLRGMGKVLMGKNTIMRKVIKDLVEEGNQKVECLLPYIIGNMGFVFTDANLSEVVEIITSNKVPAAAKTGMLAPASVMIPKGPSGLDPGQTSFFQALNIQTKITKGAIEIINDVELVKVGEKVTSSAVALLAKMNIRPFFFGIVVKAIYEDACIYGSEILDMTDDDMLAFFFNGVRSIAALSLEIGYPTLASIPHSFANAFKKILAIAVETDYDFEEAKQYKEYLANPEAFASAAPAAAGGAAAPAAEAAAPEPEEEEESEEGFGGGLFDD
jgi:large subunit ribosomal protein LP0